MARVLASSALLKSLSFDCVSFIAKSRGFAAAAAAEAVMPKAEKMKAATKLMAGKRVAGAEPSPWVPDPVTGYYRPANRAAEVDAAELRAMMLQPKA